MSRSPDEESPVTQQHFDRLTALDASFLAQEGGRSRAVSAMPAAR